MTPSLHPQGIPDDDVPRLLARAAALDAEFAAHMPLTRLREIAQEAGVSDAALAEALAEYAGHAAMSRPKGQWTRMLFANGATLLIGATLVVSAARLAGLAGGDWIIGPAMCLALFASAAVAHRARATTTRVIALGLAIALGSELLLSVTQGPIHGRSAHFALIVGSILGVLAGGLFTQRGDTKPPGVVQVGHESRTPGFIQKIWRAWRQNVSPLSEGILRTDAVSPKNQSAPAV
jgi:hypothetical protein